MIKLTKKWIKKGKIVIERFLIYLNLDYLKMIQVKNHHHNLTILKILEKAWIKWFIKSSLFTQNAGTRAETDRILNKLNSLLSFIKLLKWFLKSESFLININ